MEGISIQTIEALIAWCRVIGDTKVWVSEFGKIMRYEKNSAPISIDGEYWYLFDSERYNL